MHILVVKSQCRSWKFHTITLLRYNSSDFLKVVWSFQIVSCESTGEDMAIVAARMQAVILPMSIPSF